MLLRLRLMLAALGAAGLLLLVLCLGAQNLRQTVRVQLGFGRTGPLPVGFVVGLALVAGVCSGGLVAALLLPDPRGNGNGEDWGDEPLR